MKKLLYIFFIIISSYGYGQNVFFNTGVNITTYDYENSSGGTSDNLQSSTGSFYEIGYAIPIYFSNRSRGWGRYSRLKFKTSFTLNNYNATGGNSLDNYDWKTQYMGLRTNLEFFIWKSDYFSGTIDGGVGFEFLGRGKQKIGGETFDLKSNDEFNSLFLTPKLGFNFVYNVTEDVGLSAGFNLSKATSSKGGNGGENVQFNNSQISFGINIQVY
jgi:hypothetical protein